MIGVGIEDVISDIEEGKAGKLSLSSGVYDALVLEFAENDADYKNYRSKMTQREKDNFAAWKENAEKLLKDKLGYTDSDIKQMYEECSPDGYLSYTKVSEKGQQFLERIG